MNANKPIATGKWNDMSKWEIYRSSEMPPEELCTAVACVALSGENLDSIVLARNKRGWEILAGHIEPGETLEDTLKREALEEGGFRITHSIVFAHRKITALRKPDPGTRQASYPYPITYIPYFLGITDRPIQKFTGNEILESSAFTKSEYEQLVKDGKFSNLEQTIVELGFEAGKNYLGFSKSAPFQ